MHTHMKRTTLLLDTAIYGELKRRAALEGATLTAVVERALRIGLDHLDAPRRARVQLPSYDLGPFLSDPSRRDTMPGAPSEEDA